MAMTQKAWYDRAFISVSAQGGSDVELRSKTTSFSQTGGGFDMEGLEVFGGKIARIGSKDDIELSFDGIITSLADFDWIFAGQTSSPSYSASGSTITSQNQNTKFRVSVLWTNQTGITSAVQAITGSNEAYRRAYAEAYCTAIEPTFDAGDILKVSMTFKLPAEDETGGLNYQIQSKDTTSGTLSALASYTTTTKF